MSIKTLIKKIIGMQSSNGSDNPIKNIDDEYIDWLSFANAGMMNRGNVYCFDYAAKNLPSNNVCIEIGSFCGLTANVINYFLKKYDKPNKLICVDKWEFENTKGLKYIGASHVRYSDYKLFCKDSFIRNLKMFSSFNLPYVVEEFSDDFFKLYQSEKSYIDLFNQNVHLGGKIAFCYIDGNHTYEFTKRDFENTDKFLEIGGFILFDDTLDNGIFECKRLMPEIIQTGRYELICKNPNYFFKKIKE